MRAAVEVLWVFTKLGLRSFGGPVAHLGYFRDEFVTRRGWVDEKTYADVVALCQFLPGPASSQTGFTLGLMRAGYLGGLAAWTGFTLPSAIALMLFALEANGLSRFSSAVGALHGLQLVAVAIVAQAVWGMARTLCPDRARATIAVFGALISLFAPSSAGQIVAILLACGAGMMFCRAPAVGPGAVADFGLPVSRRAGVGFLALFAVLLVLLPDVRGLALFDAFYRSGALVFGGGHVVLPLLRDAVVSPGWVADSVFLAGYGAAQAVPGPLFTFAAYLGAEIAGVWGGVLALVAIFLPGILLLMGVLPFWNDLRARPRAQAAMRGVNAAVVGLLGAALYDPVWTSAVHTHADFAFALVGFVMLVIWRAPPWAVVAVGALGGIFIRLAHGR
jgi:chromate transporter